MINMTLWCRHRGAARVGNRYVRQSRPIRAKNLSLSPTIMNIGAYARLEAHVGFALIVGSQAYTEKRKSQCSEISIAA